MNIHMLLAFMVIKSTSCDPKGFVDGYLLYLLARASAAASGQFHAELAERGVPVLTWRVLAVLHDGPATVSRLAEVTLTKQTTLSKALDRMERDGLVRRTRTSKDRRQVTVENTGKGAITVIDLIARAKAHQARLLAAYPADEQETLIRLLNGLTDLAKRGFEPA